MAIEYRQEGGRTALVVKTEEELTVLPRKVYVQTPSGEIEYTLVKDRREG